MRFRVQTTRKCMKTSEVLKQAMEQTENSTNQNDSVDNDSAQPICNREGTKSDAIDVKIEPAESPPSPRTKVARSGKYEIIVQEKKGFFGAAVPERLPCGVAILCCILNCVVPGTGTLVSAPFSLCEKKQKKRKEQVHNFCVNILAGVLQLILAVVLVGWLWSIIWAIEFLKPLKGNEYGDS